MDNIENNEIMEISSDAVIADSSAEAYNSIREAFASFNNAYYHDILHEATSSMRTTLCKIAAITSSLTLKESTVTTMSQSLSSFAKAAQALSESNKAFTEASKAMSERIASASKLNDAIKAAKVPVREYAFSSPRVVGDISNRASSAIVQNQLTIKFNPDTLSVYRATAQRLASYISSIRQTFVNSDYFRSAATTLYLLSARIQEAVKPISLSLGKIRSALRIFARRAILLMRRRWLKRHSRTALFDDTRIRRAEAFLPVTPTKAPNYYETAYLKRLVLLLRKHQRTGDDSDDANNVYLPMAN